MSNDLISFDSPPNLISFNDDDDDGAASLSSSRASGSLNQTPKRVRTAGNLLERSPFQNEETAGDQSSTTGSNHSPTASTSSCTNLDSSHDDLGVDANNQTLEATAAVAVASNLATPVIQHKMSGDDNASLSDMNLESLGILSDIFTRSDLDTTGNEETWLCSPEELRSTNQREPLSVRKELQDMTNTSISRDIEKQKVVEWLKLDSDVDMRKLLVHLTDLCDRRICSENSEVTPEQKTTSWRKLSSKQGTDADSSFSGERQQNPAETLGEMEEMYEEAVKQAANAKYFNLCKQVEDRKLKDCVNRIIEIDRMSSKLLNEGKPLPSKLDLPVPSETPANLEDGPDALSLSDKDIYSAMITLVRNSVGKDWSHNKITEYANQVIQRVTGRDIISEAIASKYATYKKKESSRPATPTTWKTIASTKQVGGPVAQPSNAPSKNSSTNLSNRTSSVSRTNTITIKPTPGSNVVVNNPPSSASKRRPVMAYGSQRSLTASVVSSGSKPFQPQPLPSQHTNFKNSSSSYQMKHKQSASNISDISSISSGYASNNTSPNGNWSNMTTSSSMQQITAGKKINSSVHQSRVVVSTPRASTSIQSSSKPVMMPPPSPRSSRPRVAQSPSMSRKSTSSAAYQDVSLTRKSFIPVPAPFTNTVNKSHSVTRQLDVSPIRKNQIEDSSRVKGVRASSNGWWLNDPEIF